MIRFSVRLAVVLGLCAAGSSALAGSYEFLAAPAIDLNRIYRLDKATGEIGACQYGLKDGTIGVTLCYPAGEGATAQGAERICADLVEARARIRHLPGRPALRRHVQLLRAQRRGRLHPAEPLTPCPRPTLRFRREADNPAP